MKAKNIFYKGAFNSYEYTTKKTGRTKKTPERDFRNHAKKLLNDLDNVNKKESNIVTKNGEFIEFFGAEGFYLKVDSLKNENEKIRLLKTERVNQDEKFYEKALVYVPNNKKTYFNKKIEDYLERKGNKNKALVDSIERIERATLESFWIGDFSEIPEDKREWCEIWIQKSTNETIEDKIENTKKLNIKVSMDCLKFEERDVLLCYVNKNEIISLIKNINGIAEIKLKNRIYIEEFLENMDREEQFEWIKDLNTRLIKNDSEELPSVLLIDSGINNEHPLLKEFLLDKDCKGYINNDLHDIVGHGTRMAGLSLYGDLLKALETTKKVKINHNLQSYKIFYPNNDENLYGSMTSEAILFSKDLKNQINCMAIASDDKKLSKLGNPSSWSASIDSLCFGDENRQEGRLFCLSAGNIDLMEGFKVGYPDMNELNHVEDPGQSWNALTIGGYTEKYFDNIEKKEVAHPFSLSPFSKTSNLWLSKDASNLIKPEVLFEAGNALEDEFGYFQCEELSLLTTNHNYNKNLFSNFCATSAATALASNFCAKLVNEYPNAWPQTIRGLVVHSAEWTDIMKNKLLKSTAKGDYAKLLRTCGYGVPNLNKALGILKNSVNLVIENEIKPYKLNKTKKDVTYDELHIYELPWPEDVLITLSDKRFKVKVTLSYFIEPNPGNFKGVYEYQSYGLRFEFGGNRNEKELLKKVSRINGISHKDEVTDKWTYGTQARDVGSIHSDVWEGSGADFAASKYVMVYPVGGWWKEKKKAEKYKNKVKYSLIVSITSEEEDIDLYTPIFEKIKNKVKNKV